LKFLTTVIILFSFLVGAFIYQEVIKLGKLPLVELALVCTGILVILMTIGVTTIKWNYFIKSINRPAKNQICFTFDDGPHENTKGVLKVLAHHGVKSTFFLIGNRCESNSDILNQIVEEGHIIGNHSFSHQNKIGWTRAAGIEEEINKTNHLIKEITTNWEVDPPDEGVGPKFYRPPFGITNPNIAAAVRRSGMISVGWSIRSYDTVVKDKRKLIKKLKRRINNKGHIVLMHDYLDQSAEVLDELINHCKEKGMEIVNLDSIVRNK